MLSIILVSNTISSDSIILVLPATYTHQQISDYVKTSLMYNIDNVLIDFIQDNISISEIYLLKYYWMKLFDSFDIFTCNEDDTLWLYKKIKDQKTCLFKNLKNEKTYEIEIDKEYETIRCNKTLKITTLSNESIFGYLKIINRPKIVPIKVEVKYSSVPTFLKFES